MTTTTTGTNSKRAANWKDVANASAELREADDVKSKPFVDRLPCTLTNEERIKVAVRFTDARALIDKFNADTKQIMGERKSKKTKLEAVAKELEDATRTGRVMRDVSGVEHTSFALNRRWRVRLDTNETIDEQALTASERQAELPGVETMREVGDDDAGGDDEETERDDLGPIIDGGSDQSDLFTSDDLADRDSTSNIDDPDTIIRGADTAEPTSAEPSERPVKRGKKKAKKSAKSKKR